MNSFLRVNSFFPATTRNSNNENYNILNRTFNFQKNQTINNKDKIKREFGKEISNKNILTSINENFSKEKFKIKSENINKISINKKYIKKGVLRVNRASLGKKNIHSNKILNLNNNNFPKKKGKNLALSCLPLEKTMISIKPILTLNNNNRYNNHNNHNNYNITLNKIENNNNNLINNIKSNLILNINDNNNNKNENIIKTNNNNNNHILTKNENNHIENNNNNQSKENNNNENTDENKINKIKSFTSTLEFNLNPQIPKEYLSDILTHLYSLEESPKNFNNISFPNPTYFTTVQKDIKERMRSILLDWLIEVHLKFKLLPETLFLTINILDRYLSLQSIHRKYLQLLGVTSMFISCKYEEIYYPKIKDFIYMTDNAYNKDEFIKMENDVLKKLEFNLSFPTILKFLEIFKEKLNVVCKKKFFMWRFLSEICLFDYGMIKFKNSLIAAAIVYLENKFCNFDKISDNKILDVICGKNNCLDEIKEVSEKIKILYKNNENSNYHAIKKKFSLSVFYEVAKEKINF